MVKTKLQSYQKTVANEIEAWLSRRDGAAILLTGQWGVGKTFLVKEQIGALNQTAYVSLFGTRSVQELRSRIAASWIASLRVSNQWESDASRWRRALVWCLEKVSKILERLAKPRAALRKLLEFHNLSASSIYAQTSDISFYALLESGSLEILILDDLERSSKELPLDELLGFVDQITEKYRVSVVLVGNLEALAQDERSGFRARYGLEKTISHDINLAAPVDSVCTISLAGSKRFEELLPVFTRFCGLSQVDNIRLLSRAAALAERFLDFVEAKKFADSVETAEVVKLYLCLVFARFDGQFGLTWESARSIANIGLLKDFLSEHPDESKEALAYASSIDFPNLAFPELVVDHIESGFLDERAVISRMDELSKLNDDRTSPHDSEEWSRMWAAYYESFSAAEDDIIEGMEAFLASYGDMLDIRSYQQIEDLAKAVGFDVSGYEEQAHINSVKLAPRHDLPSLVDKYEGWSNVQRAIEERMREEVFTRDLSSVAREAIERSGWSDDDVFVIKNASEEDLREWLKTPESDKVELIRQLKQMDKSGRLDSCLESLAAESSLNRMRCKLLYGVSPERNSVDGSDPDV